MHIINRRTGGGMKDRFNRYCAEVMGWRLGWEGHMGNDYWYNANDKIISAKGP